MVKIGCALDLATAVLDPVGVHQLPVLVPGAALAEGSQVPDQICCKVLVKPQPLLGELGLASACEFKNYNKKKNPLYFLFLERFLMLSGCAGCHHSLAGDWAPATPRCRSWAGLVCG